MMWTFTLMTSNVCDLDAGVTSDWTSFSSGWSLVSNLSGQGAIAAMATQVPPTASFWAESCWRLKQTKTHSNKLLLFI